MCYKQRRASSKQLPIFDSHLRPCNLLEEPVLQSRGSLPWAQSRFTKPFLLTPLQVSWYHSIQRGTRIQHRNISSDKQWHIFRSALRNCRLERESIGKNLTSAVCMQNLRGEWSRIRGPFRDLSTSGEEQWFGRFSRPLPWRGISRCLVTYRSYAATSQHRSTKWSRVQLRFRHSRSLFTYLTKNPDRFDRFNVGMAGISQGGGRSAIRATIWFGSSTIYLSYKNRSLILA